MKKFALLTLFVLFLLALPAWTQINLLHEFAGGADDGRNPWTNGLIISGTTIYGMTYWGGDNDSGTIFKIQADGTGFELLHEFAGGAEDGASTRGTLILSGTTLYGMTRYGGDNGTGTIFKIETDGTGFSLLYEFASGGNDARMPDGDLVLSGSTLYGQTDYGGASNLGTVFKVLTDGSGFEILHSFATGAGNGYVPSKSLVICDSTLYGVTIAGGAHEDGTIFRLETDGSGFTLLHEFDFDGGDGQAPTKLFLSGSTLFGITEEGGTLDTGTIFKIQTDGNGYSLLHDFNDGSMGAEPYSLIISGSTLYGLTSWGGSEGGGTLFSIKADGAGYSVLHDYAPDEFGGSGPYIYGPLFLSGSNFFGMTYKGGASDMGVIYSLPLPQITKDDFLATWDGQGVYYRNSDTAAWVKLASPATLITTGDLDNDAIDDVIGIWPGQGGVWVKYSASGTWAKLSSTARHLATGDMNGDGRPELLGTWDGQGVYWRNNTSGAWTKLATPATLITAGDLDGDGTADLVGIWPTQGGVWVKYSSSGAWAKLSTTAVDIATGDMNGDGRDDLVASWDGQGVYYRNSISGAWVKLATPATQVTAGDLDGDGTDDVIGIWPSQAGVWVKYSQSGAWAKLSSTAVDIAAGKMRAAGSSSLLGQGAAMAAESENSWGPDAGANALDLSANAPGGMSFACPDGENMEPRESGDALRIPGPGELGFKCHEQANQMPGSVIQKELIGKEQR